VAARKKKSSKATPASLLYTILTLALLAGVIFLGLGLYGLHVLPPARDEQTTVLILNGCGVQGIGRHTARLLRSMNLDVIDYRNADSFEYEETLIVDRAGDIGTAARVGRLLGTGHVIQQVPETPLVDVIVVVGRDYDQYLSSTGP
jgi:hypothetical protein